MSEPLEWQVYGAEKMTRKQQKLLNAACGDLAEQINWHGNRLSRDDFRHMIAAAVMGTRLMPAINTGEGGPGLIMLGRSSLDFTRSEATTAIRMAFDIGDNPQDQNLPARPVRWCQSVVMARWIQADEQAAGVGLSGRNPEGLREPWSDVGLPDSADYYDETGRCLSYEELSHGF